MDIFGITVGRIIFNYIGATIRWVYGTIWRTILNKPKFTYNEYVNGPKNSEDHFDNYGHQFNNRIIGIIFLIGLLIILIN